MQALKERLRDTLWSALPWFLFAVTFLGILFYLALNGGEEGNLHDKEGLVLGGLLALALMSGGLGGIFLVLGRLKVLFQEVTQLRSRLEDNEQRLRQAYEQMEAVFQLSRTFVEANDENEIIQPMMQFIVEISGAQGASFVPIDEHGQPQTALSHGELPFEVKEAWLEYLSTPGVVDRCRACEAREPLELPRDCPLLRGPFANASGLVCLSVRRGEREFGVLNLFLPRSAPLEAQTRALIGTLLDEAALALEGVYLRRRELSALRQLQFLRQKSDLNTLFNSLLANVSRTLGADFAWMVASPSRLLPQGMEVVEGDLPSQVKPLLRGLVQGVMSSREPVIVGNLAGDSKDEADPRPHVRSVVAVPLISAESGVLGAILVGNRQARGFQPRQLALLQTVADQVALVMQNAHLMAELEYKTMLQERARLAREIHDGLAQTIGFLKLQSAQLRTYIEKGEFERAKENAIRIYTTLSEAYQDTRQAIDDLRLLPDECGLRGWLAQVANEFRELSGLEVILDVDEGDTEISPEVQAQLIRIVQEALSNVRKHAGASRVRVSCSVANGDLFLKIEDNGKGFLPDDITSPSQHGLRGMRERAELIGADFQIISQPQRGAQVCIRLPLKRLSEVEV